MDTLYFYAEPDLILLKAIDLINQKNMERFEFLGEGVDAKVFGFHQYAIKMKKNSLSSFQDADILFKLQKDDTFPTIFASRDDFIIMEKVEGKTLGEMGLTNLEQLRFFPNELKNRLVEALEVCFSLSVVPHDLHLHNVMYDEQTGVIKIIDVGKYVEVPVEFMEMSTENYKKDCKFYQNIGMINNEKVFA